MPGMDGIELAEALQEQNPNCKVVLISGNRDWKARKTLPGSGLEGFIFLPKPFSPSQLVRLIKSEMC